MTAPTPVTWGNPVFPGGAATSDAWYPTGMQVGDLVVMFMVSGGAVTPPAGWTMKGTNGGSAMSIAYHWVDGTEGAMTGTWTASNLYHLWPFLVRGSTGSGDPFDGGWYNSYNLTATTPASSLTTTGPDRLLLWVDQNFGPTGMSVQPSGMTSWYAAVNYVHAAFQTQAVAGATGTKQATMSAAAQNHTHLVAIKPASPFRYKDGSGNIVRPDVRVKDSSGDVVEPSVKYKDSSGTVHSL